MKTMFEITAMDMGDLQTLAKDEWNRSIYYWSKEKFMYVAAQKYKFSCFVNGELAWVCGLVEYWSGRAHLWAFIGSATRKYPVASFRAMQKFMEMQPYRRVEASTPIDLDLAGRRLRMLGFSLECKIARKYGENGESESLYSWVREE